MSRPVSQIRYGNRLVQQKQENISLQKHYQSLKKTRPMTGNNYERETITLNNKKRQMVQQNRFTEIERQNRMLFQKITTIMHKGTISQNLYPRDETNLRINKTLNGGYRKKQMQNIEYQNAKMLKRLKQKKSSYQARNFHKDWQKKKEVIKKMSLYPFIINDNVGAVMNRQKMHNQFMLRNNTSKSQNQLGQTRRVRRINGFMFLITLKFEEDKFFIIGDIKEEQNIKIIELDSQQALQFINEQCSGDIQKVFNLLRYDRQSGDMYLVGKDVGQIVQVKQIQRQKARAMSHHGNRQNINRPSKYQQAFRHQHYSSHIPPRPISKQMVIHNRINLKMLDNNEEELFIENDDKLKANKNFNLIESNLKQNINAEKNTRKQINIDEATKNKKQINQQQNNKNTKSNWVKIQNTLTQQNKKKQQIIKNEQFETKIEQI